VEEHLDGRGVDLDLVPRGGREAPHPGGRDRSRVGELSLLLRTTHTKNAMAVEDSELMVVPQDEFEALLSSNPEVAEHFQRKIEERTPIQGESPG
jgi:signal-transduction protein with cAMP-binding, CBS, and nucleotidyltransferase domain